MDFSIVESVVAAFAPLGLKEIVPSTMGEPFLYRHMEAFLALAGQWGLQVNITTNGTFPYGGVLYWAPLLWPVLSDIKISVMGATAQTNEGLMQGLDHQTQQANIVALVQARQAYVAQRGGRVPTISLQMTVREENAHEVAAVRDWARAVGVDRVKTHPLWIIHEGGSRMEGPCPFLGREAWVWVDGTFQVCPNPDVRYGFQKAQVLGGFGCFKAQNPVEVWQGLAYQTFCKTYDQNPICQKCSMRRAVHL